MKSEEIAYIILTFVLAAAFIGIFFFTYISKVEGEIIQKEIDDIVSDLSKDIKFLMTTSQKKDIGEILKSVTKPDMSEVDNKVMENNKKLFKQAIYVFVIINIIGLIIVYLLWKKHKFSMKEVLKNTFIILSLVALTELFFVTYVTKNYILVDSNYIKYTILNSLQKYSKT